LAGERSASWPHALKGLFPETRFDEPLRKHTTFRIGGPADAYLEVREPLALTRLLRFAKKRRVPAFALGWGSKLLVRDGGLRGIVFRLRGDFEDIRALSGRRVYAGAGVRLQRLVMWCAERDLAGAEPLVGVPGTVGGALVMNAGTSEGTIGDLVRSVHVLDARTFEPRVLPRSRLRFRYRGSSLSKRFLLGGTLELNAGNKGDIIDRVDGLQRRRLQTQPVHSYNVGSVFKNPPGFAAARLIQEAGLKGRVVGGARVSPKHANFIENTGRAKAGDVLQLVEIIRGAVRVRTGLDLELEMQVVGEEASRPA